MNEKLDISHVPWQFHVMACILCFAAGAFVMYRAQTVPEVKPIHRPEVIQSDGSRILKQNPEAKRPALPQIPQGFKVIRVTTAKIEPKAAVQSGAIPVQSEPETVEITEIQGKNGETRMIASTEDGKIIGGGDWVGPPVPPPHAFHWQALAVRSFTTKGAAWGASLGYTRGPFVASVTAIPGSGGSIQAGIGVRW